MKNSIRGIFSPANTETSKYLEKLNARLDGSIETIESDDIVVVYNGSPMEPAIVAVKGTKAFHTSSREYNWYRLGKPYVINVKLEGDWLIAV